jgi:uncharacterized protein
MTIGELTEALRLGRWFRDYYLTPFSGAIWSTPKDQIMDFPARAWCASSRTTRCWAIAASTSGTRSQGGSVEYVRRLERDLRARGVDIRTGAPVAACARRQRGWRCACTGGEWERFDEVVFATHSDVSAALLADATPRERAALGAVGYQDNHAVLHADPSVMPKRRKVWASWTYTEHSPADREKIA